MTKSKTPMVAFRPKSDRIKKRLQYADRIGLNISNLMNEMANAHFDEYFERAVAERKKELSLMQKALAQVPA